jgi:hypothetical protein
MKRAWPYALALAVVVTGCYLLLAPLLRSLSPAPTTSASQLSHGSNSVTVGKAPTLVFVKTKAGQQVFVSNLKTAKKAKKTKKPPVKTTPTTQSSTGFANNDTASSSGSSSSSSSSNSTTPTQKAPTKTTPSSTGAKNKGSVGGAIIDQGQAGNGFATQGNDGPVTGSQTLAPGS